MPPISLHLTPREGSQNHNGSTDPLPHLLQTPSGLALLEIQGTINMPTPEPSSHEHDTGGKTSIGRLVFPDYVKDDPTGSKSWMKRVYLYVGRHQRLTGEVKKLVNPVAVIGKRIGDDISDGEIDALEIVEVVYYKLSRITDKFVVNTNNEMMYNEYEVGRGLTTNLTSTLGWALTLLFSAFFLKIIVTAIYNVYFHPLAAFPGPKAAAATSIPFVYRLINGHLVHWTTSLHASYGGVVRICPDELSFIEPCAWQDIYVSRPQLPRAEVGKLDGGVGKEAMIRADNENHARQRRIVSHAFSDRALREQEYLLIKYTDLLVSRLHDQLKSPEEYPQEVNICKWMQFVTFDIVGDLCFGESFHSLESMEHHEWVSMVFKGVKFGTLLTAFHYFPTARRIMQRCVPSSIKAKAQHHYDMTRQKVDHRINQKSQRPDFIKYIRENNNKKGMSIEEIYSTVSLLVLAGSETSAGTCTAAIWYSLKKSSVMEKLKDEIRGAFTSLEDITVASASGLPYLHAVLQESLRMHPSEPVALPREVNRPGMRICGRIIPKGTRVGIAQKTAYLSPVNFVDPLVFNPERWLEKAESRFHADRKAMYEPFMVGPRACLGKSLAWAEMSLIMAKVIWSFDLELSENNVKDWSDQKVWLLNEPLPLNVKITSRA